MTNLQTKLHQLITEVAECEGTTEQCALRDVLTDLWHVANMQNLDIQVAFDDAESVFDEEKADK